MSIPPQEADRTPASTLRRAATLMRQEWPIGPYCPDACNCEQDGIEHHPEAEFHHAVATWLDACALVVTAAPSAVKAHAHRIARAYLGETA